jgi:hypothetical protein
LAQQVAEGETELPRASAIAQIAVSDARPRVAQARRW